MTAVLDAPVFAPAVIPSPSPGAAIPVRLTYTEAVTLLFRAVAEYGAAHRAPGAYFRGAKPECLIGVVLSYKGVTAGQMTGGANCQSVTALRGDGFLQCDDETEVLLQVAQVAQDRGLPWGEILANLDSQVRQVQTTGRYQLAVPSLNGEHYTENITVTFSGFKGVMTL